MNKRFLTNFILTILLSTLFSLFLPWWSVMLAAFISGYVVALKKANVFFAPFFAVFFYWGVYAFMISSSNDFLLAKKIAILLPLDGNPYVLILITALIGGLSAGIAGTFGREVKSFVN